MALVRRLENLVPTRKYAMPFGGHQVYSTQKKLHKLCTLHLCALGAPQITTHNQRCHVRDS
jgi:hypothetical protein